MSYNMRHVTAGRSNDFGALGGIRSASSSVGGILRKAGHNNQYASASSSSAALSSAPEVRHVDLLVFGYACKVFRDDDKARDIDQGKHLIPWMGDNSLKIDRYDVRGALYELTPYEPPPGGYGNRLDYLTADEQRAEQLCEEERYLFLYNNEDEYITNQDVKRTQEELKRLKQETNGGDFSQVGPAYDQPTQIGPSCEAFANSPSCEEAEQVFQLPQNFVVPADMNLPETMKQHAIIEKTARFIASQGVQMEILLKAKQSNNVQFDFLSQSSLLNPYYKHMLEAIKTGKYPEKTEASSQDKSEDDITNSNASKENNSVQQRPVVLVPTVKYKPSADCAYTQLISKIKGVPLSELHDESSRQSTNSPLDNSDNGSPSITPVLLQYNGATFITEQDENSNSNSTKSSTKPVDLNDSGPKVELLKNSSALALAQNYSSASESEADEDDEETSKTKAFEREKTPPNLEFPVPTDSLKNIIDKTAVYVVKNGRQFEETLRSKSAERFTFLLPDNEYYPYYMYKITGDPSAASKESKQRKAKEVAEALLSKKGLSRDKNANNPVSFSIKAKEEGQSSALQNTVLPQDASDEEDKPTSASGTNGSGLSANRHVPEHVQKAIELVESQLMARNAQIAAALALRQPNVLPVGNTLPVTTNLATAAATPPSALSSSTAATAPTKAEAERNAIFEQQQQQKHKELKKAEEKVKDKLAQIAREKLGGLVSKEKQLQLERKKKAMAFLNQIKAVTSGDKTNATDIGAEDKAESTVLEMASDDSEASVQSIPITSYGPEGNSDEEVVETTGQHKMPQPIVQTTKLTAAKIAKDEDDDVQILPEATDEVKVVRKRKSRSRTRDEGREQESLATRRQYRRHESGSSSDSSESSTDGNEDVKEHKRRSKSRNKSKGHKSKKSKAKKSKSKKKSKRRERSRSRSRTRSRSRSYHHAERRQRRNSRSPDGSDNSASSRRYRRKRSSKTPSRHAHKDKRSRYD